MDYLLNQVVRLTFRTFSDAAGETPADPTALTITVRADDLTSEVFAWPGGDVTRAELGVFTLDYPATAAGHYEAHLVATGNVATSAAQTFDVRPAFSQVISVEEIRSAALNKTLPDDDAEIQRMLDAALAEYSRYVGPLPGSRTEYFDGGGTKLILSSPNATAVTAAEYSDGTAITVADLTVRNGIVGWGYNTTGRFTYGAGNVTITYTVGSLAADHREAIIADVAGYFAATQRGGGAGPSFTGEAGFEAPYALNPIVLFPRIRALAGPGIA